MPTRPRGFHLKSIWYKENPVSTKDENSVMKMNETEVEEEVYVCMITLGVKTEA